MPLWTQVDNLSTKPLARHHDPESFPLVAHSAWRIIQDGHFNKDTGFSDEERKKFRIEGLLPIAVETVSIQVARSLHQCRLSKTDIDKYVYLLDLQFRNQTLFYRLLTENLLELLPIVYTPTVGEGCQRFSEFFRPVHGLFVSSSHRGRIGDLLHNWHVNAQDEVAIIVISDGSRILGLGDLGANGMGIPVGKCSLYVAAGGFHPATALPVLLDTGTNNAKFLKDPFYVGERHKRVDDKKFYELLDEFMAAVYCRWPSCLVQFEDFSNDHCFEMLKRYRNRMLCFNDDIQGTGCVIAAGFLNAMKVIKIGDPRQIRVLLLGAGSAGIGVAEEVTRALQVKYGITKEEGINLFYMVDSKGLLTTSRTDVSTLAPFKLPYLRKGLEPMNDLMTVIEKIRPHALIGLSAQPGRFTVDVIAKMAEINERPIIFPLSNPTKNAECSAAAAYTHSSDRVVFCSGSPFPPVTLANGNTLQPSQGNNMYIFPGLGFGSYLAKCSRVTNGMLTAVTVNLADQVSEAELEAGLLYPPLTKVREVSSRIAGAAIEQALKEGVAGIFQIPPGSTAAQIARDQMYHPEYVINKI